MTEEEVANLGETTPKEGGAKVEPQPEVSSATEQDSPSAENLVAALQGNPEFTSWLDSRFQSWKDKRLDKHETELGNVKSELVGYRKLKEEIEAIKKKGFTEEQAEFLIEQRQSAQPPDSPGKTEVVASEFDADSFYREQGIDPNAPEVIEMIRKGATPNEHFKYALGVKTKPEQPPNPAQVMPTGSGETTVRTAEQVRAEIDAESRNPKGVNFARMQELDTELRTLLPRK